MNTQVTRLLVGLFVLLGPALSTGQEKPASQTWIARPWELRYFIEIGPTKDLLSAQEVSTDRLDSLVHKKKPTRSDYWMRPTAFFKSTQVVTVDKHAFDSIEKVSLSKLVVEFNKTGEVQTPNTRRLALRGHLNELQDLVLADGDSPTSFVIDLGHFWMGFSDGSEFISPALCRNEDLPRGYIGAPSLLSLLRYSPGYDIEFEGAVGCREWAYQLLNPARPYIDVTTYVDDKTLIQSVIGWSLFNVKPKPVIGQHYGQWVCLHECPNNEAPGLITDIKQWAAKNGWPVPERPAKQPQFPDADFQRGEPDDEEGHFPNATDAEPGC